MIKGVAMATEVQEELILHFLNATNPGHLMEIMQTGYTNNSQQVRLANIMYVI